MSLLNEMLRDLHQRQALPAGAPGGVMAGVVTPHERDTVRPSRISRQWLVFPVFAVAAAAAGYAAAPHLSGDGTERVALIPALTEIALPTSSVAVAETPEGMGQPAATSVKPKVSLRMGTSLVTQSARQAPVLPVSAARDRQPVVTLPNRVLGGRLSQTAREASVILDLDRPAEFRVFSLTSPPRLVLDILEATGSIATGDMIEGHGPVKRVRAMSHADGYRLVLDLVGPVSIRRSALQGSSEQGHLLTVELTPAEPEVVVSGADADFGRERRSPILQKPAELVADRADKPASGSMAKTVARVDRHELAESRYRMATQLLNAGRGAAGEAQLRAALSADPTHGKAREALAARLLSQRQYGEADDALREGLMLRPADVRLHMLNARLLMERGEPDQAIAALQRLSPKLTEEPEFHALRAALLHKTRRHEEAAQLYRALVDLRPEAGVWWMGLAMALEANDEPEPALKAYDRAADQPDMSANLVRFIEERIRQLQEQAS